MSDTKEDNFGQRAATVFVFIFLLAAICETLIAGIFR